MLILCLSVAEAQPVTLACYGDMRRLGPDGANEQPEKYSLKITIDQQTKTAKVEDYEPVPLFPTGSPDTFVFAEDKGSKPGVSFGTLDRSTGQVSIDFDTEVGLVGFEGVCNPS